MLRTLVGLLASIATVAAASPSLARRVLHERLDALPPRWSLHRRADPDVVLPLSIALRQGNIDNLDEHLLNLADPESPNYGQWWTPSQVVQAFQPSTETKEAVRAWLSADGIDLARVRMSKDHSYMLVNVSVAEAEQLLATKYYVYQHEDGSEDIGCHHGYHLPEHVRDHVDLVTPTVHFEMIKLGAHGGKRKRSLSPAGKMRRPNGAPTHKTDESYLDAVDCDKAATIDCFRALYNFYPNLTETGKNSIGVVELADQTLNADDLTLFLQKFNPDAAGILPAFQPIDLDSDTPDFNETDPDFISEPDLDFELVMGLISPQQPVQLFQVGGSGSINFLLDAFDGGFCSFDGGDDPDIDGPLDVTEDCGGTKPANVISVSFTGGEDFPPFYMQRQCAEIGKLSMMGITFLFASGDNGVASNGDNLCLAANGTAVPGPGAFLPNFPSTCPYVTAVGATQVDSGKSVHDPESATSLFGSGGGFSNVFPRPEFQKRQVAGYLKQLGNRVDPSLFNSSGRGIPDVSANGLPTVAVIDANYTLTGGTSASTPIFAAILTAVNDARLAANKTPVGWINPAIYSHWFADAFHDITNGTNPGCGTDGFPALRGWDPVTGLGTPDFPTLVKRFLWLP
ncbi:subtilisin-like protein [Trametes versicolor FP-101664 SS1]|uniref:subtilisin-like protein n=1 Tax=Trametes versicolor (strain FP-101664) TaxID=717944 RepID=UPI000462213A|nr:subtilisin-like protein [Trametes versicolor FP-101664 SS1]EIW57555.1 subtilisin-like protein [Trametes versicolor FP-101664 SS1]